jgi:anti-sigma B factor antagonist
MAMTVLRGLSSPVRQRRDRAPRHAPRLPALRAAEAHAGSQAVLALAGDIDITTAHMVRDAAARCLRGQPASLALDLRRLDFCDCAGVRTLRWAQHRAATAGSRFRIIAPGPQVRRILALAEASDLLGAIDDPAQMPRSGLPVHAVSPPGSTRPAADTGRPAAPCPRVPRYAKAAEPPSRVSVDERQRGLQAGGRAHLPRLGQGAENASSPSSSTTT